MKGKTMSKWDDTKFNYHNRLSRPEFSKTEYGPPLERPYVDIGTNWFTLNSSDCSYTQFCAELSKKKKISRYAQIRRSSETQLYIQLNAEYSDEELLLPATAEQQALLSAVFNHNADGWILNSVVRYE